MRCLRGCQPEAKSGEGTTAEQLADGPARLRDLRLFCVARLNGLLEATQRLRIAGYRSSEARRRSGRWESGRPTIPSERRCRWWCRRWAARRGRQLPRLPSKAQQRCCLGDLGRAGKGPVLGKSNLGVFSRGCQCERQQKNKFRPPLIFLIRSDRDARASIGVSGAFQFIAAPA